VVDTFLSIFHRLGLFHNIFDEIRLHFFLFLANER
jgi:hypothetical protein